VCTIACPFGTVNYETASGKVAKCDLCGGDPWCAKACPTGAITYIEADQTGLARMRAWAQQGVVDTASVNLPVAKAVQAFSQG
jgi:Fe-S-cluster-containing dehydrogenase component